MEIANQLLRIHWRRGKMPPNALAQARNGFVSPTGQDIAPVLDAQLSVAADKSKSTVARGQAGELIPIESQFHYLYAVKLEKPIWTPFSWKLHIRTVSIALRNSLLALMLDIAATRTTGVEADCAGHRYTVHISISLSCTIKYCTTWVFPSQSDNILTSTTELRGDSNIDENKACAEASSNVNGGRNFFRIFCLMPLDRARYMNLHRRRRCRDAFLGFSQSMNVES
ncbi:hypothetical protein ACMFMF_003352 [Clarireedia jacksonii]